MCRGIFFQTWFAVCALNLLWAHLWADKNRFKCCRPESCSACPPNISVNESLWCSWRPNNNYKQSASYFGESPVAKKHWTRLFGASGKARRDPSCLQFHLTITLKAHCTLLCVTPLRERKCIKGSQSREMINW